MSRRDGTCAILKGHFSDGAERIELFKSLSGRMMKSLNGIPVLRMDLTLHCVQRDAFHVRLPLQNAKSVRGLDTLDLARVAREENTRVRAFRQREQAFHLPP